MFPNSLLIVNLLIYLVQCCWRNLLDQKETRLMCKSSLDTLVSSLSLVFGGLVSELVIHVIYCLYHFKLIWLRCEIFELEKRFEIFELEWDYSSCCHGFFRINFWWLGQQSENLYVDGILIKMIQTTESWWFHPTTAGMTLIKMIQTTEPWWFHPTTVWLLPLLTRKTPNSPVGASTAA